MFTVPSILVGVALALIPLTLWGTVFLLWPRASRAVYRQNVWEIRDALVDDVISGRLSASPAADRLLRTLHVGISGLANETAFSGLVTLVLARDVTVSEQDFSSWLAISEAPPADQARLQRLADRYVRVSLRHLATGSLSGVVLGGVVLVLSIASVVARALSEAIEKRRNLASAMRTELTSPKAEAKAKLRTIVEWEANVPPKVGDEMRHGELTLVGG